MIPKSDALITKENIKSQEIYLNFKSIGRFNLKLFYQRQVYNG